MKSILFDNGDLTEVRTKHNLGTDTFYITVEGKGFRYSTTSATSNIQTLDTGKYISVSGALFVGGYGELIVLTVDEYNTILNGDAGGGVRKLRAACAGVSFMQQQTLNSPSSLVYRQIGFLTHFFAMNGWPWSFQPSDNFAKDGALTEQIISNQLPNILTSHNENPIDTIFLSMGTNDTAASIPFSTITANMKTIFDALTKVGIKVVIETIPPRGVDTSLPTYKLVALRVNKWLEKMSNQGLITLIDTTDALADKTTAFGNAVPSLTYDPANALHPNTLGARAIAGFFDKYYKSKLYPTSFYATQNADVYDAVNNPTGSIFDNPILSGGTTAPTGYTTSGGTWAAVDTTLASGQTKRSWRCTLANNATHFIYRDLVKTGAWVNGDKIQVGDKLELRAKVVVTNATGLRDVQAYLSENNGSSEVFAKCLDNTSEAGSSSMSGTYTYDLVTPIYTVREYAGSGNVNIYIRIDFITDAGAGGTVTVEAFELRKVY